MNALQFGLVGPSTMSVRMAAYNMLTNWHEMGMVNREKYRNRDDISAKCAEDLGPEAEDNAIWNSRIAAWLRERVNEPAI